MGALPSYCCNGDHTVTTSVVNVDLLPPSTGQAHVTEPISEQDPIGRSPLDGACVADVEGHIASTECSLQPPIQSPALLATSPKAESAQECLLDKCDETVKESNRPNRSDAPFAQEIVATTSDTHAYMERQWIEAIKPFRGTDPAEQLDVLERFLEVINADPSLPKPSHKLDALRFLRARKFDIQQALAMYSAAIKWRKEFLQPAMSEAISDKKAAQLQKAYPASLVGRDLRGRPCKVFDIGAIELRDSPVSADDLVRHHIREMEKFSATLAWRDLREPPTDSVTTMVSPLEGGFVIIDVSNCNVSRFWNGLHFYKKMAHIDQNCYPEILGKTVVVSRGHWAFDMAWGVASKFLDAYTLSKVEAITDKEPQKRLAEFVAQDVLPPEYRINASK